MSIAFIGYGNVGLALADRLQRLGHDVGLAVGRDGSEALAKARARNGALRSGPAVDVVAGVDVVFLAIPFSSARDAC